MAAMGGTFVQVYQSMVDIFRSGQTPPSVEPWLYLVALEPDPPGEGSLMTVIHEILNPAGGGSQKIGIKQQL